MAVHEVVLDVTHFMVSRPQIFTRHVRALLDPVRIDKLRPLSAVDTYNKIKVQKKLTKQRYYERRKIQK